MARYDNVTLALGVAPSIVPAIAVPSLGLGLVAGAFTGLAARSGKAGVITGVVVGGLTAALLTRE